MKRFAIAAILVAALGFSAVAQPPPPGPPAPPSIPLPAPPSLPPPAPPSTPPPLEPPVGVQPTLVAPSVGAPAPNVFVPPGTPVGPAIPVYKSGGVVVGVYGYYPYDSGQWLLGGTDGLTRQSGAFTMVFPDSTGAAVGPVAKGSIFHHKARCR